MHVLRDAEGKFVARARSAVSAHRRARSGNHFGASVNRAGSIKKSASQIEAEKRERAGWRAMGDRHGQAGREPIFVENPAGGIDAISILARPTFISETAAGRAYLRGYGKRAYLRDDPNMNRAAIRSVGDPEPETKSFYAAMLDITQHINKDALVKDTPFKASQIDKVYEVVIFTLDERVHLASLTPSTYYETISIIVKGKDYFPDDDEEREKWHEMEDELLQESETSSYMDYADAERIVGDKKRQKWMRAKNIGDFESMDDAREHAQGNSPF